MITISQGDGMRGRRLRMALRRCLFILFLTTAFLLTWRLTDKPTLVGGGGVVVVVTGTALTIK